MNKRWVFRLSSFFKSNRSGTYFLLGSLVLLGIVEVLIHHSDDEVSSYSRLLRYTTLFIFFITVYFFVVKYKKVLIANVVLVVLLFLGVEITCFFLLGMPSAEKKDFSVPLLPEDHIGRQVGTVLYSDSVYHSVLYKNDQLVYDVTYSIDGFHKRITPDHDSLKKQYALFFGCSIAFGEGLNDNETFPYFFQQNSKDFNAYNFASSGYGANHMLAKLEYQDLSKQVKEKEGYAFYVFFWDHIYRTIGSMNRYCDWLYNAPYYEISDGQLIRNKSFKDGRYVLSKLYQYLYQLNTVKYFQVDFPLMLSDRHFNLVTEIILSSKKKYKEQFGNDNFVLVLYPSYKGYTDEEFKRFQYFLEMKKIRYIDLSTLIEYGESYTLGGDPHPNANTNNLVSNALISNSSLDK